jgi:hypothetical protein
LDKQAEGAVSYDAVDYNTSAASPNWMNFRRTQIQRPRQLHVADHEVERIRRTTAVLDQPNRIGDPNPHSRHHWRS